MTHHLCSIRIFLLAALLALLDAVRIRVHPAHPIGIWAGTTGDRIWSCLLRARIARLPVRPALGQIRRF